MGGRDPPRGAPVAVQAGRRPRPTSEAATLEEAIRDKLGGAIEHYEQTVTLPIPDKMPIPLAVHRHEGQPCPRCGTTLEAVFYEDYVMSYCPSCQTGGRVLKDRRLSRLLK